MTSQTTENNTIPYRVVLVDDSGTIRSILKKMLSDVKFIEVVGEAENGIAGIDVIQKMQPDIVLLDIEMPEMDGITALPHILKVSPTTQIIMVSTLTAKNAEISIKAMGRGAADCLQKPEAGIDKNEFKDELVRKIQALGYASKEKKLKTSFSKESALQNKESLLVKAPESVYVKPIQSKTFIPEIVAIASSTGGPQALQEVFGALKGNMPNVPVFITQHMPPVFTKYLASNLAMTNGIDVVEAEEGMEVKSGRVYIAPGNFHMLIKREESKIKIKLDNGPQVNFCRPAADPMFHSLVEVYGGQRILTVVLTGMGQDGLNGAKEIAQAGGIIIAQDEASSVVWGMPGAVCEAGITNGIYPITKIADRIIELCSGKGGQHVT